MYCNGLQDMYHVESSTDCNYVAANGRLTALTDPDHKGLLYSYLVHDYCASNGILL